jgi:hypothetical protein
VSGLIVQSCASKSVACQIQDMSLVVDVLMREDVIVSWYTIVHEEIDVLGSSYRVLDKCDRWCREENCD